MSLSELWLASPGQLSNKQVKQLVSFSGDGATAGQLRDESEASREFRDFLEKIPSEFLSRYADECLKDAFEGSGFVLQDIINQVGKRLGFNISYGRYRGTKAHIGYDGLWCFPDKHTVIVEVKTTDAYRIDLDSIANYRRDLLNKGECFEEKSSILIIVGRQDTGDLEAQIRGSRHAWDIRLISVDALLRLMTLKEEVEDPKIGVQICAILIPKEFTRLDSIIDIVFSTAEDIRKEEDFEEDQNEPEIDYKPKFTPVAFHEQCIKRIEQYLNQNLLKHSKVSYSSSDGKIALISPISKEYNKHNHNHKGYWFAFHPYYQNHLESTEKGFIALGCGTAEIILMIPYLDFKEWLNGMNITKKEDRMYWHISIANENGNLTLHRRRGEERIPLSKYILPNTV